MKDFEITSIEETEFSRDDVAGRIDTVVENEPPRDIKTTSGAPGLPPRLMLGGGPAYNIIKQDGTSVTLKPSESPVPVLDRAANHLARLKAISRLQKRAVRLKELARAKRARVKRNRKREKLAKASRKRNR